MALKPKPIPVRAGEIYRVPRKGKPAAFVKITRVVKGVVVKVRGKLHYAQPKVAFKRVTKMGKKRAGEKHPAKHWLQFRDGAWHLPAAWELAA
jgi:hypothetical protein